MMATRSEHVLEHFHPAVAAWFRRAFDGPTDVQTKAWPEIRRHRNTLIAAPTGSGKTLAAFFATIDDLVRQGLEGTLEERTQVVYVSPLKALSNDIHRNLQVPLAGIRRELERQGLPDVDIRVLVRTGDTPQSERAAMVKRPPHILVTTPESLYLLLTSENGRKMLATAHTAIVDEIHALVGDKRGSHLSLSLERLAHLSGRDLVRVGLSATQKPIETVADFLVGARPGKARRKCTIIDVGHRRKMDVAIEVPRSPLTAVMPNEVWGEIYERLEALILEHQTTLIFVNTRRLAERMAHNLTEQLGPDLVTAHHGSMSREHRLDAERRLKNGTLRALVATASLELGIDIGSVDLVCQIGSPKTIAALLQRVGRSGHSVGGTPKGRVFPLSRSELWECAAVLDAVRRGELDRTTIPQRPLDILAQQIVAEVAAREYGEDELYDLIQRAYPYRDLAREDFDRIVAMLADGFTTRKGRRWAYLHRDIVNARLRARRGARLTAITSGGAIPDNFDFDVVLEPSGTFIGTVNEDFAIESMTGDVFQLGNNSWRILGIDNGRVRVEDAKGLPPSIPFWFGEAPGRSQELSSAVSRVGGEVVYRLGPIDSDEAWKEKACRYLTDELSLSEEAADQLVTYLAAGYAALGAMPSQETIVMERFFDEAGDMHLVIHAPFGSRLNRAWGLALRKRFCRKFNFELQAAAAEDSIILSLGATHSFPLDEVASYLSPKTVRNVLTQALLDSPMFGVRWRWTASRALAVRRRRGGKKVPPAIQRMQSEDLVALVFPDQLACLENIQGEREIPDHPLVLQTIDDCLTEAMDIDRLERLLAAILSGAVRIVTKDLREPSPFAENILNARPYSFLDDAPLEERRANAVQNRRWLDATEAADLGKLDPSAIEAVRADAWPYASGPDELHDALVLCGVITVEEGAREEGWTDHFHALVQSGRGAVLTTPAGKRFWVAVERSRQLRAVYPEAALEPALEIPQRLLQQLPGAEGALVEIVRGRLEASGPLRAEDLADLMGLASSDIERALLALEGEGFVLRGQFTPGTEATEWCERRLLARIHRYTLQKLRREIEPVSPADFMRFLFAWHGIDARDKPEGAQGLQAVLDQLEGIPAPAAAWEGDVLPARTNDYDYQWLDALCASGSVVWGRFRTFPLEPDVAVTPVKSSPVALVPRSRVAIWRALSARADDAKDVTEVALSSVAEDVKRALARRGALFFDEIVRETGLLRTQAEDGIRELVALGLVSSDGFAGLRALLVRTKYRTGPRARRVPFKIEEAGRWSLLEGAGEVPHEEVLDAVARVLLKRYGVVFRKVADRESLAPAWRDLVRVLRRMEARGELRGGRFVDGVWGEQYALPESVPKLRAARKAPCEGALVSISAADPLNLTGIVTPGRRVPAITTNRVLYRDGVPVAVKEGEAIKFLTDFADRQKWDLQTELVRRNVSPRLRAYLGKGIG